MFRAFNTKSMFFKIRNTVTKNSQNLSNKATKPDYDHKFISKIEQTRIEVFQTKFRNAYSPYYWNLKDKVYEQILNHYPDDEKKAALVSMKTGGIADLFASFCWPLTTTEERMRIIMRYFCFMFLEDDCVGTKPNGEGINELSDVILGNKNPEKPIEIFITEVIDEIKQDYTEQQLSHFKKSLALYPSDHYNEIEYDFDKIASFEEMLRLRFNPVSATPSFHLIPFSMHIDITGFVEDPNVARIEELMLIHSILINDLYSFKKEIAKRNFQQSFNTLLYLYKSSNDLVGSVEQILVKLSDTENEFFQLKNSLIKRYPNSLDLRKYIDGLEYWCGGNYFWSLFCPRYNKYNKYPIESIFIDRNYPELISIVVENLAKDNAINQ